MKKIALSLLTLFSFFLISYSLTLHGSTKGFPKKAPEINGLITDEGKPFFLSDLKGKVLLQLNKRFS